MAAKKEPTAAAVVDKSDKKKALEGAMQQIERLYGKGSIMRYGAAVRSRLEGEYTVLPFIGRDIRKLKRERS